MDKTYWNNFYKNNDSTLKPSSFARFIASKYTESNGTVIDVGCGNGRDTFYFSSKSIISVISDMFKTSIIFSGIIIFGGVLSEILCEVE